MSIVLLGAGGYQGKAALYDLVRSDGIPGVIAADIRSERIETYLKEWPAAPKVSVVKLDAEDNRRLSELIDGAHVVISLLPSTYALKMATLAIDRRVNLVDSGYIFDPATLSAPETQALFDRMNEKAIQAGVTILRECGMDPGIDLLICGRAVRELDEVHELISYGSGFPEPEAANNPLGYKISWNFDGVLRSYKRAGRYLRDGQIIEFSDTEMFSPKHTYTVDVPPFGILEAFPNGDAIAFARRLGLEGKVKTIGRFVFRWPGHTAFWHRMAKLGFLDEKPIRVGGVSVSPKSFVWELLEPQLQYGPEERDVAFIRVEVKGLKNGRPKQLIYQVIDRRDLQTGLMAMQRTVGFSVSIGAQMILRGDIRERGLLSPLNDVPFEIFAAELAKRNIHIALETS